jgi:peptide/nickel transport system substrate-binding protein
MIEAKDAKGAKDAKEAVTTDMNRGTGTRCVRPAGAAALVVCLSGLAACGGTPARNPDVITLAVFAAPATFDPRVGVDEVSQKVYQLVYDNLFNLDEQLRLAPGLAERLEQRDAVTYLVHLRRGVRFHDGHELTSADVVHTFRSLMEPSFVSARKGAYALVETVDALDAWTVRFTLRQPFGSFPIQLVLPIVPVGAGLELRERPVGTGAYRFVRYSVDSQLELAAFADYFGGAPANAGVVLKIVPDEIMRGLELRKGSVDLVVNDLSPDTVEQLRRDPALEVVEAPGTDYAYIGLNLREPMLADRRVRRALAYSIDRDAIVQYLRRGLAQPAVGVVPPLSWAFAADAERFTHDPVRAGALLDEAGYPDPDGEGPASRLRLTLKVSTNEFYRLQATVIQQDLRRVGIDLDVRSYEFATLAQDVARGNFQLVTLQWVGVSDPDMLRRVFHSKQRPPDGFNRGHFVDPEVDRLIDDATVATDDAVRLARYREVQRRVAEEAPYISLWYKTNVAVARRELSGIHLTPLAEYAFLRGVGRRSQP